MLRAGYPPTPLVIISTSSCARRSLLPLRHGGDPLRRFRTGSGSNRGQLPVRTPFVVVRKQISYLSILPRYQSVSAFGTAPPPLRDPTA